MGAQARRRVENGSQEMTEEADLSAMADPKRCSALAERSVMVRCDQVRRTSKQ
jgi:hypothetical protein